jgi:deferrochelatase/peroxidase EfeB
MAKAHSRREVLGAAGKIAVLGAAATVAGCDVAGSSKADSAHAPPARSADFVAFHGTHQAGISTPVQERLIYGTFDLVDPDRASLRTLLRDWTVAAAALTAGRPVGAVAPTDTSAAPGDTGEAIGLAAKNLTITFGLGRGVFVNAQGDDRLGLARLLPPPLIDLPPLGGGEVLDPERSGGDISVQCCADDAQVAFHAFHNLVRIARGNAAVRWTQLGFGRTSTTSTAQETPRNLQGFKDGTNNLKAEDAALMREHVWVEDRDQPAWMRGGTYVVTRRIRMLLETWDRSSLADQQDTIGREKVSGAPLGGRSEHDVPALGERDASGAPVIPADAHIRLAAPSANNGIRILRRGYSFSDGVDTATGELDAGLFFIAYQRDPRRQFVPLQRRLGHEDALNEYIKHVGSGIFAVLPGVPPGGYLGQGLFE